MSHAWGYAFADVVQVLLEHEERNPNSFFWFDLFTNNQHTAVALPQEWWATTFRSAIGSIGQVLLVFTPWSKPVVTTRCWCLWEMQCALWEGADLAIGLPKAEEASLRKAMTSDVKSVMQHLSDIQSQEVVVLLFLPSCG